MIGVNQHIGPKNRQKTAHFFRSRNQGLVFSHSHSKTQAAGGCITPVASAIGRNITPYYLGRVVLAVNSPSDFFIKYKYLQCRREIADCRLGDGISLRAQPRPGLVRPAVKRKKQGSSGCEQRDYWQYWPYLAALRPAAIQPQSKRFSVAQQGLAQRSCSMATQLSVSRQGPQATCFIANKTQGNVTDRSPRGAELANFKMLITGPGIKSAAGGLRCQTPMSKDT